MRPIYHFPAVGDTTMPKKLLDSLTEVLVSTTETASMVNRYVKQGVLRKIASRLYTKNMESTPEVIVRKNLWKIVSDLVPDAIVADRTAIEVAPATDGSIFVISNHKRNISLPGISILTRKGHIRLDSDKPFIGSLFIASTPRAYLENMKRSVSRDGRIHRTLSQCEVEERLDKIIRLNGEDALISLRNDAHKVAKSLDLMSEFNKLDTIIGALLQSREVMLKSAVGKFRSSGKPFDPDRVEIFEVLFRDLRELIPLARISCEDDEIAFNSVAFFEAYFSNYIEGIDFPVQEARKIVFENYVPPDRSKDAHDILGTWKIVSNRTEMCTLPKSMDELVHLLKTRHSTIMGTRPEFLPGKFKVFGNQAGATVFVAPELVLGTLEKGFEYYRALSEPFSRAIFMMFLIAEVHPFADGNGRIARVMMNSELVAANQTRIIIPTIFRGEYLAPLRNMSRDRYAKTMIRSLDYAQKWVHAVPWTDIDGTAEILDSCNAFEEVGGGSLSPETKKLEFPS